MNATCTAAATHGTAEAVALVRADVERRGVVFNDPQWVNVVSECYGFADCTASVAGGSLPLFHTSSPLFGSKVVSAVYNSYASPLFGDVETCARLVEHAVEVARSRAVAHLELKCLFPLPPEVVSSCGLIRRDRYCATFVPLSDAQAPYSANFRRNLRRAYRRVGDAGLRVERTAAGSDLRRFYAVLVRRYRDKHLMIPQPWRLFELLRTRFLEAGRGDLWLVRSSGGEIASGVLCLRAGPIVTACFGARDDAYGALSADAVLKDAMMRHYGEDGARVFDLGITSPLQSSVLFAKNRFGGITVAMPTYYFPVRAKAVAEVDYANAYLTARRLFRYVPLWVVRRLSPMIVPYLN